MKFHILLSLLVLPALILIASNNGKFSGEISSSDEGFHLILFYVAI